MIEPVLASAAPISSAIASFQPDLLLLDAALLEPAAQHLSSICAQIRPSRLVLLMDAIDSAWAKKISANGVYGVLLAGADVQHCCSALRKIGEGEAWLPRWLLGMALEHCRSHHFRECEEGPPSAVVPLTQREREIATLAAGGLSNKEIAWNAGIAVDTVKRHLKRAFAKLRVRHRGQLAARLGDLR